jgi:cytochrome bd ubiquinol oxidase subunit II
MQVSLNLIWFGLLGVLLTGYGVLDGFDLGVGILHLFARDDDERRIFLNSIGPLWDGNEVWLVTFAGALFAAFPNAYALAFSGFYLPLMCVLVCIIFRAVSIEFRSKWHWRWWRSMWDIGFCASSTLATFLFGVIVGNMFIGLPFGADMEFYGTVYSHFSPYPILVGLFAVSACAMHGSIFLHLKTEGELQEKIRNWMWHTFGIFLAMYMIVTIVTLVKIPSATANLNKMPGLWIVVLLNVLAIANIPRAIYMKKPGYAFISSICTLAALASLFGMAIYPNLIVSSTSSEFSLNVYNAASSHKTLGIMLCIACLGLPFVFAYTAVVYWVFHGKVRLGKFSY